MVNQIYKAYWELPCSPRWQRVFNAGAGPHCLLWASTGSRISMVPAAVLNLVIADLLPLLKSGDTWIEIGNSIYLDDIRRFKEVAATGRIHSLPGFRQGLSHTCKNAPILEKTGEIRLCFFPERWNSSQIIDGEDGGNEYIFRKSFERLAS